LLHPTLSLDLLPGDGAVPGAGTAGPSRGDNGRRRPARYGLPAHMPAHNDGSSLDGRARDDRPSIDGRTSRDGRRRLPAHDDGRPHHDGSLQCYPSRVPSRSGHGALSCHVPGRSGRGGPYRRAAASAWAAATPSFAARSF
ncbi:unnamed protein product, partial [Urochloa humidicola]